MAALYNDISFDVDAQCEQPSSPGRAKLLTSSIIAASKRDIKRVPNRLRL